MIRVRTLFVMLVVLFCVCLFIAVAFGSVSLPWAEVWAGLSGDGDSLAVRIVRELRLGRALSAFVVGGMLALAGSLMQVLLRNPLADPYVLGISGGAAVLALATMLLGLATAWVHTAALCGALLSMLLVFALAHGRGQWTTTRLLLTGVVVAAGWGALISLLLALSPDRNLRGMLFWLMGDLGYQTVTWSGWLLLGIGLLIALYHARPLNLLTHGEDQAALLGVDVSRLRLILYFLASLLTGAAVMLAGSIGFVGLVIPHLVRLLVGGDHRVLLPAAVVLGGSLLMLADVAARTLLAPQQLPVGVVTALIGVPVFLLLLYRNATLSTRGR